MASTTSVANLALQKLGANRIETLTEGSPNARALNAVLEHTRDIELQRYDWGFAIRRAQVAADADAPTWGDWNRYGVPGDFLRLLRDDETGIAPDWRIEAGADGEGRFIITADASPIEFRYIARIVDPNAMNALFLEAWACRMAYQTCEKITGSTGKRGEIKDEYKDAIAEARRLGAIEKPAQEAPEDSWILSRL